MSTALPIAPRFIPPLDPAFVPASLWNRAYRSRVAETGGRPLAIALERSDGSVSVFHTAVLPHAGGAIALDHPYLNQRYVERLLKFLLWQEGGWQPKDPNPMPSLFDAVEMAPRDPILGLNEQFAADPNPAKVNLGVGVYSDEDGRLPL